MKKLLAILLILTIISCKKNIETNPNLSLSPKEQLEFKNKIVRYFEGLPKNAHNKNVLDTSYQKYYNQKAQESDLIHYYSNDKNEIFFAITKIAPSIKIKKVATIGKVKFKNDSIVFYQEIARTWKMEIPELHQKTKTLFDLIIQEKNIEKYYTKNSNPDFWIEFPDDNTTFDTISRTWRLK